MRSYISISIKFCTYQEEAAAPTWGVAAMAPTAAVTGAASSAVAAAFLIKILRDLPLELALAAAAAFFWGELVAMELVAVAAAPTTGEVVSPANGEAPTGAATAATALEDAWRWDAWRGVVMPTAPATGDAATALVADTAASLVGGDWATHQPGVQGGGREHHHP
jgi:hypothetical protein